MLSRRKILRLLQHKPTFCQLNRFVTNLQFDPSLPNNTNDNLNDSFHKKVSEYQKKITYNTFIHGTNLTYVDVKTADMRKVRKERYLYRLRQSTESIPIALSYLPEYKESVVEEKVSEYFIKEERKEKEEEKPAYFPFRNKNIFKNIDSDEELAKKSKIENKQWMSDYDCFDDNKLKNITDMKVIKKGIIPEEETEYENKMWQKNYGTPDPTVPASDLSCRGCGAILHCIDTTIPGYLPSEIFKDCSRRHLKQIVCQRCHFLSEYNIALNVNVSPEEYPKIISKMEPEKALALLIVDILDFPNSIWPGIADIIGHKRPVIVVGNKVDMLPPGEPGYLKHVEQSLIKSVSESSINGVKIKDVALISAKTGFGIEGLITKLHDIWKYKGNVYIIGCTNVGKSTLFNALLNSDYCKSEASDLIDKATVSQWPGTTLNLLKFPIFRITDLHSKIRAKRLITDEIRLKNEEDLKYLQGKAIKNPNITLMGYIGRTFRSKTSLTENIRDPFSYNAQAGYKNPIYKIGVDEFSPRYLFSKWCYDTPGVIHPEQILTYLTLEELKFMLPKSILKPRTYYLFPETTLLLAGLGRIDYLEGKTPVRFTVLASEELPVTICETNNADEIYRVFLGTPLLRIPFGGEDRMKMWPKLEKGDEMTILGKGKRFSSADITLSSAGWVAVTGEEEVEYKVVAWTPGKKGINLRIPSVLPHAVCIKGKRIRGTPAYNMVANKY